MSRPSTAESTPSTPRGILDTLRESTAIKVTALRLSALTLVGCGKSNVPENPCVNQEAGKLLEVNGNNEWYCMNGARTDGKHNPGSEDLAQRMGTPVPGESSNPANIPTTVATPSSNPETLNDTQKLEAAMTKEEMSHTYHINGEAMTFDQLVEHFTIPASETDPVKVSRKITHTLNEVANGGNTVEEYLAASAEFAKDPTNIAKSPEAIHGYFSDAAAEALFVGNIDTVNGLGNILNKDFLAAYTKEFAATGKNADPFKVTYAFSNVHGSYKKHEAGDQYSSTDTMGFVAKVEVKRTGSLEQDIVVQNGVDTGTVTVTMKEDSGRWLITGAGVVWEK